jgi:nucleotide-binding universal stress UspA family protein
MFKHLFVPVDGSELSIRAMDTSIALAASLGASITGFIVESDIPLAAVSASPTVFVQQIEAHEARTEAHAHRLLNAFAERAQAAGVSFASEYRRSDQTDAVIAEVADIVKADLIVMVTHGRGAFGELLFGSHTKNVMSRTKVPLLVLH